MKLNLPKPSNEVESPKCRRNVASAIKITHVSRSMNMAHKTSASKKTASTKNPRNQQ